MRELARSPVEPWPRPALRRSVYARRFPESVRGRLRGVHRSWREPGGKRERGEWLAHNVPNAEAVIGEQGGHMPGPNLLVMKRFGWLVQPV
jgi:hypothetical protein